VRQILGLAALRQETLLFMLVSAMDVCMTYILLSQDGGKFVESNPVARFFIYGWGVKGMLYFKSAMVLFVCLLAQIIVRHRPRTARWLLIGATAVVAFVVAYSVRLLVLHGEISEIEISLALRNLVRSVA
jgi:Domain of unknown function (DUF5658)